MVAVNPFMPAVTIPFLDFGGCLIRFIARRWLLIVSLVVLIFVLAACGGPPPVTSWPGYVVQDNTAYLASANQLTAVELGGDTAGVQLVGWPVQSTNAALGYYATPAVSPPSSTAVN